MAEQPPESEKQPEREIREAQKMGHDIVTDAELGELNDQLDKIIKTDAAEAS